MMTKGDCPFSSSGGESSRWRDSFRRQSRDGTILKPLLASAERHITDRASRHTRVSLAHAIFLVALALVCVLAPSVAQAAESGAGADTGTGAVPKTVRVGYYERTDFQEGAAAG